MSKVIDILAGYTYKMYCSFCELGGLPPVSLKEYLKSTGDNETEKPKTTPVKIISLV